MLCRHSNLHRFKLIVESDLNDASLHVINTFEPTPHNHSEASFQSYRICEDTLVSCWINEWADKYDPMPMHYRYGVYTGLTSARFSNLISYGGPAAEMLLPDTGHEDCRLFSCPASGRFVLLTSSHTVSVLDLF